MSFVINEKEKNLPALTKFHVPYPGLKKLMTEIEHLQYSGMTDPKFGSYKTTHENQFPGYGSNMYAEAHRPAENGTAKSIAPAAKSDWTTTAGTNFGWKECAKEEPIRSGTASGQRRNNPHPHDTFMTLKLNKNHVNVDTKGLGARDENALKRIFRDQLTSTYETDFHDNTGNIVEMRAKAAAELNEWKRPKIPTNLTSTESATASPKKEKVQWDKQVEREFSTRQDLSTNTVTYGKPVHHKRLDDNTTRYGCNLSKMDAAVGAVPTVIHKYIHTNPAPTVTSYQSQFLTPKKT